MDQVTIMVEINKDNSHNMDNTVGRHHRTRHLMYSDWHDVITRTPHGAPLVVAQHFIIIAVYTR